MILFEEGESLCCLFVGCKMFNFGMDWGIDKIFLSSVFWVWVGDDEG